MLLEPFDYHRPMTLEAAQEYLDELGDEASLYAGGTELLLLMKLGLAAPGHLIDLKHIPSLARVEIEKDTLVLGATATHSRLAADPRVRAACPALAQVFGALANPRVRRAGTLGGNLSFGDPQSDPGTILLALGASVELASSARVRSVPLEDFAVGPYETTREDNELVTEVRVAVPDAATVVCYERFVVHHERPVANASVVARPDGTAVLAIGALTAVPQRYDDAGAPLMSGSEAIWRQYVRDRADQADLLTTSRSAAYDRNLFAVIALQAFRSAYRELSARG